jgi:hypothetical protein
METNNQNLPPVPLPPNSQIPSSPQPQPQPQPTSPPPLPLSPKPSVPPSNSSMPPLDQNIQFQNIGVPDEKKIARKVWIIAIIFVAIVILISYLMRPSKKQIEMATDYYCAAYRARYDSGLGKPMDSLQPTLMFANDISTPAGQKYQSLLGPYLTPLISKYHLDSGNFLDDVKNKSENLMKNDSFKASVLELLRQKDECHAEYLE